MAKIHYKTLAAAVEKYKPFHEDGIIESGVKALIADDEKNYDDEAIEAIYAAIVGVIPEDKAGSLNKPATSVAYIVRSSFRDINDYSKVHIAGADVSHFDSDRLKKLVEAGLVKVDD